MCGISFYFSKKNEYRSELEKSLNLTKHRGPDHTGTEYFSNNNSHVGLGHNRLSIIDTSPAGNQPMIRSYLTIIFNGEIYNFTELKNDLIKIGHKFINQTDTEVILALFQQFGVSSFSKLKGMFSFVLLDSQNQKLYVVRDSIGIKPIYLYQDGDSIFGCSEIKGLKAFKDVNTKISRQDVFEFFNTGFLYEPDTGYQYIKKLEPGTFLDINLYNHEIKYRTFQTSLTVKNGDSLEEIIRRAVSRQEVADVPLGVFFSGGTDSSILAAMSTKSELFFVKYSEDPAAEIDLNYSKKISDYLDKSLRTTPIVLGDSDVDELMSSFSFVAEYSEELISDYTFWAAYLLSIAARDNGYKVMLSGMGGDEVYAGYPRYTLLKYHKILNVMSVPIRLVKRFKLFPLSFSKKIERLLSYTLEQNWALAYSRLLGYFSNAELNMMFDDSVELKKNYEDKLCRISCEFLGDQDDKVKLAQYFDSKGCLSHNLMVTDKASMLASIEVRVPLLDEDVVANGLNTSSSDLILKNKLKSPLKNVLGNLIPSRLVERKKTGFNPPLDKVINKIGKERIEKELIILSGYLLSKPIEDILESHFQGESNNTYKIWQLLYFSQWLRLNT